MPSQQATYGYDSIGRLNSITFSNGDTVTYNLDAVGNRTGVVIVGPPPPPPTNAMAILNGFRFSLSSSDPVPASDILAATMGYLVPFTSDVITLLNSSGADFTNSSNGASLSISFGSLTAGNVYRIFASDPSQSGTTSLTATQWASSSSPGSSLNLVPAAPGGFLVLSSDKTKRYVADVYCAANGQVNDALQDRGVFNQDNRIARRCAAIDTTSQWITATTAQPRDNNTSYGVGRFGLLIGNSDMASMLVSMDGYADQVSVRTSGPIYTFGFALDGTTSFTRSAVASIENTFGLSNGPTGFSAMWVFQPALGRHYFQAMEFGPGTSSTWRVFGQSPEAVLEAYAEI